MILSLKSHFLGTQVRMTLKCKHYTYMFRDVSSRKEVNIDPTETVCRLCESVYGVFSSAKAKGYPVSR